MSFDLSWDIFAVLKGGMRIPYSGADPTRNRGCTELLPCMVVSDWNKQAASALSQLWALSHASMIVSKQFYWAIKSTKIWITSGTAGMYHGSLTWLGL